MIVAAVAASVAPLLLVRLLYVAVSIHRASKRHDTVAMPHWFVPSGLVVQWQFQYLCSSCIFEDVVVVVVATVFVVGSKTIDCH